MNITFEQLLETAAKENADRHVAELDLVDAKELAKHLKLTGLVAGAAFLATVGLIVFTRMADLPEKRLALAVVVTLAFATLCVVAALSAVGAAATAFARQRLALLRAQSEREKLALQCRQVELDADHATARHRDMILAWHVGSDVLFDAAAREAGAASVLDNFRAYMIIAEACSLDEDQRVAGNAELVQKGLKIFSLYESKPSPNLMQEPAYSEMKMRFTSLAALKHA